ncbi:IniB N-terminal domain-containing protein [Mycobacterium sp.]|jgi:hypothetical protein|uniref:IniB N-terminal domain-containing protein n=1 Tax=Mycobacterium sp. TaxID=1785 RepID=UPI002D4BE3F8|nr:IniB N-terminal domain-containing protein [Mycobacterium sp.]HZA11165.1 IniB N-terminal domain-containing protein [Mycobacterium sp.]
MVNLIDYLLDLFRDETQARAFVSDPNQALANAGFSDVTSAQLQSVAATAVPSLALNGGGDPVAGLQQAVSSYYGYGSGFDTQPSWDTGFSPTTDLASGNSFLSPDQQAGANAQNGAVNLGFGDITLGGSHTEASGNAVVTGDNNRGDIVSGDGAVLGNGNTVNNGNIHAGSGSSVTVGDGNSISQGNTTAGGDVLSSHDGTVIQTSGHGTTSISDGNTTNVHGNQTITDIHGTDNTSGVDNSTTSVHTSTVDNSVHDNSTHSSLFESSVHNSTSLDSSVHDNSIHETAHQNTGLDNHLGF